MQNIRSFTLIVGLSFILAAGMGCSVQKAATQAQAAPEADWRYPDIVDVDFVARYVKVPLPEGVMIIDARPKKAKYDKGHIPMAVSIPDTYFDKMTAKLPADKDTLLIFYCGGLKCKLSHKSAFKAEKLGYTNIKVFAEGYPAYKTLAGASAAAPIKAGGEEGSIDIAEFEKLVKDKPESVYLIDVRDADEFAAGSFKTAVNIPVDKLEEKVKDLPSDKPIIFICGTGARSGESFYMLQDLRPSLKNVYYLDAELTIKKDGSFSIKKSS
jgi:rhodanese-related sulfurtransferase